MVAQAEAAGDLIELNDKNFNMRGNLSAQSDPNKDALRENMASVAMRTWFSDAGMAGKARGRAWACVGYSWGCAGTSAGVYVR